MKQKKVPCEIPSDVQDTVNFVNELKAWLFLVFCTLIFIGAVYLGYLWYGSILNEGFLEGRRETIHKANVCRWIGGEFRDDDGTLKFSREKQVENIKECINNL